MRHQGIPAVLCAAIVLSLLCGPALGEDPIQAKERMQFADGLYARGMYKLCIEEYEGLLKEHPSLEKADVVNFRLGESYRELGDYVTAERYFRTVYTRFPKSELRLRAGFRRAELFMKIGQYDSAVALFKVVLEDKPSEEVASATYYLMGESLLQAKKPGEAQKAFEQVISAYPDSAFYSYALLKDGQLIVSQSEDAAAPKRDAAEQRALELFGKAIEKPASDRIAAEAWFQVAELHFRRGGYEESARAYHTLREKFPNDTRAEEARLQAAWAAHNAGLYADGRDIAIEVLNGADHGGHNRAEWLYLKANCDRQLMKNDEAVEDYAVLLREFPDSRFANPSRYELALTHFRSGSFEQAIAEAQRIAPEGDIRKDVYWLLAESYGALDRQEEAVQYYRLLARDFPQSNRAADALYRLGHHLQQTGQYQEAASQFTALVTAFPDGKLAPQALYASAYCFSKVDMQAEAVRDWTSLITRYADSEFVEPSLYQKAMGEIRLERDDEALATLRELLKRYPKTEYAAEAHYWQGMLLREDERPADAEAEFRTALTLQPRPELAREIHYYLAGVLHEQKEFEEAAQLFQPLLDSPIKEKFSPELCRWLSEYRLEEKQYDEAIAAAQVLVERRIDPAWTQAGWTLIGRALRAQQKIQDARQAFTKALATPVSTPFAAEAALRLGEIALSEKSYDDADAYLRKAATLADDDASVGIRARAYAGLGRASKARSKLADASRYYMSVAILYDDPELVPECLYEAAKLFSEIGDLANAARAVTELRERYPDSKWARDPTLDTLSDTNHVEEAAEPAA